MSHMPDLSRKKQQEVYHNPGPDVSINSTYTYTQVEVWDNKKCCV